MKYLISSLTFLFVLTSFLPNSQAQQVKKGKLPDWLVPQGFDAEAKPSENQEASYYYLLLDEQENISKQEQFIHYAYKILSVDGVQEMADLSLSYDPAYEEIIWHQITVHRNGEKKDQMPLKFNSIQRETSADRHLYDGSMTCIINLSDIRVGDIVEYSFTRKGYNPIYGRHIARSYQLAYTFSFDRSFSAIIVPNEYSLGWKYENTDTKVLEETVGNATRFTWEVEKPEPVVYYSNEPSSFDIAPKIYCTTFKDWTEVSKWAKSLFQVSKNDLVTLQKATIKEINVDDTEAYITAAINFVQDEVRYLGFESGINSHKPHAPSQVWNQRFGDCKDKSLLLVALLQLKNIEAFPLLVNTRLNKEVANKIPSHHVFNHCIVWYQYNGETKIIDPTINNQGGDWKNRYCPDYGSGLLLSTEPSSMISLPKAIGGKVTEVQNIKIENINGEASLSIQSTFTGHEADFQRSYYNNNSKETIQKNYLTFYGNLYPDVQKSGELQWSDNREENVFTITEEYKVTEFWRPHQTHEGKVYCEFYPQTLESYFNVEKSNNRKAPYQLIYPLDYNHTIEIHLPEEWPVESSNIAVKSAYYEYDYTVHYEDRLITLTTKYKTLQEAIPTNFIKTFVDDHTKMMANLSYTLEFDNNVQAMIDNPMYGYALSILSLGFGAWLMLFLYKRIDPPVNEETKWKRQIGGWLVLPAIGLCITPFRLLFQFFKEDYLLDGSVWVSNYLAGNYFIASFVLFEQVYNILFLLFAILLIVLFFQQRTSLPKLIIVFYASNAIIGVVDSMFAYYIDPTTDIEIQDLLTRVLAAMIWIPYFIYSERVQETFVHTLKSETE